MGCGVIECYTKLADKNMYSIWSWLLVNLPSQKCVSYTIQFAVVFFLIVIIHVLE